jgi:hypothetical protein
MLLEEEMRRVIAFGRWKARWWSEQVARRSNIEDGLVEGLRAYAMEHVFLEDALCDKLENKWRDMRTRAKAVLASLAEDQLPEPFSDIHIDVELDEDRDD